MQFDPKAVREIMWQGMTEDEYRNAQEPIEEVFDEAGRSCVRLLWAALASKFGKKGAGGEHNVEFKFYRSRHQLFFLLNECNSWG